MTSEMSTELTLKNPDTRVSGQKVAEILQKTANAILVIALLFFAVFFTDAYIKGYFETPELMRTYIQSFGVLGPVILTFFQMMQVLVPVLPGMVGSIAGGMIYGMLPGFLCNYIGISIGSIIAFWLARTYGSKFVIKLVGEKKYDHYVEWVKSKPKYTQFLIICFLLPLAPDDFLCLFTGLAHFDSKKFIIITFLTKPWCLLLYSFIFSEFGDAIVNTIKMSIIG